MKGAIKDKQASESSAISKLSGQVSKRLFDDYMNDQFNTRFDVRKSSNPKFEASMAAIRMNQVSARYHFSVKSHQGQYELIYQKEGDKTIKKAILPSIDTLKQFNDRKSLKRHLAQLKPSGIMNLIMAKLMSSGQVNDAGSVEKMLSNYSRLTQALEF